MGGICTKYYYAVNKYCSHVWHSKKITDNLASLSNLQAEMAVKKLLKEVSVRKTPKFDLDSRHAIYTLAKQYNSIPHLYEMVIRPNQTQLCKISQLQVPINQIHISLMLICILKIFLRFENVISQVIIGISSMGKYNKTPYSVSFQLKGDFFQIQRVSTSSNLISEVDIFKYESFFFK